MELFQKTKEKVGVKVEICKILKRMSEIDDQTSDEYDDCLRQLERLSKVQNESKYGKAKPFDPNELVKGGFMVLSLFAIMHYEEIKIFAGKAFNFWQSKIRF